MTGAPAKEQQRREKKDGTAQEGEVVVRFPTAALRFVFPCAAAERETGTGKLAEKREEERGRGDVEDLRPVASSTHAAECGNVALVGWRGGIGRGGSGGWKIQAKTIKGVRVDWTCISRVCCWVRDGGRTARGAVANEKASIPGSRNTERGEEEVQGKNGRVMTFARNRARSRGVEKMSQN